MKNSYKARICFFKNIKETNKQNPQIFWESLLSSRHGPQFFCRMEQKAKHFCLTVWGPPECEEEGGWILCQISKQMKNTGKNQSCQAGEEEEEQLSLYFLPCALAGVKWRALPGAALASKLLQHSLQSAGDVVLLILSPQKLQLSPVSCSFTSPGLDLLFSATCCRRKKEKGTWLLDA